MPSQHVSTSFEDRPKKKVNPPNQNLTSTLLSQWRVFFYLRAARCALRVVKDTKPQQVIRCRLFPHIWCSFRRLLWDANEKCLRCITYQKQISVLQESKDLAMLTTRQTQPGPSLRTQTIHQSPIARSFGLVNALLVVHIPRTPIGQPSFRAAEIKIEH